MLFGVVGISGGFVEKVSFEIRNVLFLNLILMLSLWLDEMFLFVIKIVILV